MWTLFSCIWKCNTPAMWRNSSVSDPLQLLCPTDQLFHPNHWKLKTVLFLPVSPYSACLQRRSCALVLTFCPHTISILQPSPSLSHSSKDMHHLITTQTLEEPVGGLLIQFHPLSLSGLRSQSLWSSESFSLAVSLSLAHIYHEHTPHTGWTQTHVSQRWHYLQKCSSVKVITGPYPNSQLSIGLITALPSGCFSHGWPCMKRLTPQYPWVVKRDTLKMFCYQYTVSLFLIHSLPHVTDAWGHWAETKHMECFLVQLEPQTALHCLWIHRMTGKTQKLNLVLIA